MKKKRKIPKEIDTKPTPSIIYTDPELFWKNDTNATHHINQEPKLLCLLRLQFDL